MAFCTILNWAANFVVSYFFLQEVDEPDLARGHGPPAAEVAHLPTPERGYSKRTVEGAVILRSRGSVSVMTPKATTRPMPMIV
jgi:hypothetical protein